MSEYVFVFVRTIEIIIVAQQLLSLGYLACAIGSVCRMTEQVTVCLRLSEGVQSFHLHNNEVGSEVFDRVCLPSNCAHVLMGSVLHYFADPGLSQRPQLQRNRARSKGACVSVRL